MARTLNVALGAALGIGALAIVMGASSGTVMTSSPIAAAQAAVAPVVPAPSALVSAPFGDLVKRIVVPAPPSLETARVAIALEHGLKQGRVKVWVDDKIVLDELLASESEGRSLIFIKKRKGRFTDVLEVAPGQHTLRLQVDGDGGQRSAVVRGLLRSDQTRLLVVKVGGNLSMEWKS